MSDNFIPKFTPGQLVICTDNKGVDMHLTLKGFYVVKKYSQKDLLVIDSNSGIEVLFFEDRFRAATPTEIESDNMWRDYANTYHKPYNPCQCGARSTSRPTFHLRFCPLNKE